MRWLRRSYPWLALLWLLPNSASAAQTLLDDFEDVSDWNGLTLETAVVQQGAGAGRWADTVTQSSVSKQFEPPLDLSASDHLGFWLHSAEANGAQLQLVLSSENNATSGSDYYSAEITIDWQGWRFIWLSKDQLPPAREPLGWDHIESVSLSASGWGHTPVATTNLVLDRMAFADAVITDVVREQGWSGADFHYDFDLELSEPDGAPLGVDLSCSVPADLSATVLPAHVDLGPSEVAHVQITVTVPASVIASSGPYASFPIDFVALHGADGQDGWTESVATPAAAQPPPRTLLTAEDFSRIDQWAGSYAWASSRRQRILDRADGWPASFTADYGLGQVELPPEGGQWGMHYVCPDHGVNLQYEPPMTHRCPVDGQTYTGWPYDQVIYSRQHNDLANAARDAGLAYQLTGQQSYALVAQQLLLDYATAYASYPIHDTQGGSGGSGAHILSQTLDESGWLIDMAWAYDLVGAADVWTAAERTLVEQQLLRASAATIAGHDAGLSNWQAWHNAAIAAAGRAIDDPRLVAHAIHGPSGFERHMAESVLADGFWYESSWGYHFYTLSPMTYLAEMGARGSFPLYEDPALQSMYLAPILFAPPDLVLPAFNDSGTVDLRGSAGWRLEAAYKAYGDERLLLPLLGESRDEQALFWGAAELPTEAPAVTESLLFEASGYGVVRGGTPDDPWYLALDYGAHGGWHGHLDKLGFVLFARGEMLGIDPGSHSYALPLHDSWDRSTMAHNTVTVDETDQQEATGTVERFVDLGELVWVRAGAGEAYESVSLHRDLAMIDGYVIDHFEAQATDGGSHQYDWLYHNPGELTHDLAGASAYGGFPNSGGYQHLANNEGLSTADDARFTFSFAADGTYPGGLWTSEAEVVAESTYDDQIAHGGNWSGRLHYDFGAAPGAYVTYRTRSLAELTEEVPTRLAVWVHGDGSANTFQLRIVDATGESHVTDTTPLDFSDWQQIAFDVDGTWSSWGGDDNGVIDLPLDNLVFQLNHESGGATAGAVHVDDWVLTFPTADEVTVEDYERLVARERVWLTGGPDTTYVVGEGIGPDLTVPVPYVMVRRQGTQASFDALHEPHGLEGTTVSAFELLPTDGSGADRAVGYRVRHEPDLEDILLLVGAGAGGTERGFGSYGTDGILAWARRGDDGLLRQLALAEGSHLFDGQQELFVAPAALQRLRFVLSGGAVEIAELDGEIANARLLAPATTAVTYQGGDVPFVQDGDYVVFGSITGTPPAVGPVEDDDGGCGCSVPSGQGRFGWAALLAAVLGARLRRRRRHRNRDSS